MKEDFITDLPNVPVASLPAASTKHQLLSLQRPLDQPDSGIFSLVPRRRPVHVLFLLSQHPNVLRQDISWESDVLPPGFDTSLAQPAVATAENHKAARWWLSRQLLALVDIGWRRQQASDSFFGMNFPSVLCPFPLRGLAWSITSGLHLIATNLPPGAVLPTMAEL